MQVLDTAHTHSKLGVDAIDLESLIGDSNAQLVIEALYRLRETKVEALGIVRAEGLRPDGRNFEPWDFGIPQIDHLLTRFGVELSEDPSTTREC